MDVEVGSMAPDFALKDAEGKEVKLSDFRGRKVALYFYPKDMTPGCTRQACAFAASYAALKAKNVEVIGISKDSAESHQKFAAKHDLPFVLLSDPDHQAAEAYGVWGRKVMFGKETFGTVRTCFVIDEAGRVLKRWKRVKPDDNAQLVLKFLDEQS